MKRSKFSLSHYKLLTGDMGYLMPISWFEALPGDTIQMQSSALIRFSPLNAPPMHPCTVRIHHWFVPNELIWENWPDFITGGEDGLDATVHPYIDFSAVAEGGIEDLMGVPVGNYSPDIKASALPFRAFNLIYNDHYRDQDLCDELVVDTGDGADTTTDLVLPKVAWGKDYFTTTRPWTQKGAQISIPLGDEAVVKGIGTVSGAFTGGAATLDYKGGTSEAYAATQATNLAGTRIGEDPDNSGYPDIYADLSTATGIPIADLRLALGLQRYQEARAVYGSRYTEYLAYLGVNSRDRRRTEPEFLGGGRNTVQFSEVLAHDGSNTGAMYGHGISALRSNRFRKFIDEHGIVMTLMSVVPKAIYTQGLNKKWSREVKEDYFQKELQFIGEDEVYNREVYAEHTSPDDIFGYQARYDEYRSCPSSISGEFLSTLDHWHLGRIFSSDPALNNTFIECTPSKRIFQSTGTHGLYVMANHSIQARRMIAKRAYNKIL